MFFYFLNSADFYFSYTEKY